MENGLRETISFLWIPIRDSPSLTCFEGIKSKTVGWLINLPELRSFVASYSVQ